MARTYGWAEGMEATRTGAGAVPMGVLLREWMPGKATGSDEKIERYTFEA